MTVNAKLAVASVASPNPTEVRTAVSFTGTTASGISTVACNWNFGDVTTGTGCSTTHTYTTSGTFIAMVTATDGLGVTATNSVTVTVNAKLTVTVAASPNPAEVGVAGGFTASTTGGVGVAACSWTFGDGGTARTCTSSHTYTAARTFNATVTVTDTLGVTATTSMSVVVNVRLTLTATVEPNPTDEGVPVSLTPVSVGGVGAIACSWDFGDTAGTTGCSTTHTYTSVGTFTAIITATDEVGVTAVANATVTVNPVPGVDFNFGPAKPMAGEPVNFTAITTGGSGPFGFSWNYGDGGSGSAKRVSHTYAIAGAFNVTVIAIDRVGETATLTYSVAVTQSLAVGITSIAPSPSEIGVSTSFAATAIGGTSPYVLSWDFLDGGAAVSGGLVTHTFNLPGRFVVTVGAADSANHTTTATLTLVVNSRLRVTAVASPNPTDEGVAVGFTPTSSGGVGGLVCSWSFGDGWSANRCDTTHTYATTGTFSARLTATDVLGVTALDSLPISLTTAPTVSFTYSPASPTTGQAVAFAATTTGGASPFKFVLNYGDGSPEESGNQVTHTYAASGVFKVSLTIKDANGGTTVTTLSVSVVEKRSPVFSRVPASQTVSVGQSLTFAVSASDPQGGVVTIIADSLPSGATFDRNTGQFSWTPTTDETGNYSITFTAVDSGTLPIEADQTIIIQVKPGPAQFCPACYRTLGLPLDDGVVASLGFLGLISALVATLYVGIRGKGESESTGLATNHLSWEGSREDGFPGQGRFVEWVEDESP
jgi:PKD repeat protein